MKIISIRIFSILIIALILLSLVESRKNKKNKKVKNSKKLNRLATEAAKMVNAIGFDWEKDPFLKELKNQDKFLVTANSSKKKDKKDQRLFFTIRHKDQQCHEYY